MKKNHPFCTLLWYHAKQLWPLWILMLLPCLCVLYVVPLCLSNFLQRLIYRPLLTFDAVQYARYLETELLYTSLPLIVCAVILAALQHWQYYYPRRARMLESLPYTRLQQLSCQLLAGVLTISLPFMLFLAGTLVKSAPLIHSIQQQALISPFYQQISQQNPYLIVTVMLLRMLVMGVSAYFVTSAITRQFGNVWAGLAALALSFGAIYSLAWGYQSYLNALCELRDVSFEELLLARPSSLFAWGYPVSPYAQEGLVLPWNDLIAFLLPHLTFIGISIVGCVLTYKKLAFERLPDIFVSLGSRIFTFLMVLLGGFGVMLCNSRVFYYAGDEPNKVGIVWDNDLLILILVVLALIVLIFFLPIKRKLRSKKALGALALAVLLGVSGGAHAAQDINAPVMDNSQLVFLNETAQQQLSFIQDMMDIANASGIDVSSFFHTPDDYSDNIYTQNLWPPSSLGSISAARYTTYAAWLIEQYQTMIKQGAGIDYDTYQYYTYLARANRLSLSLPLESEVHEDIAAMLEQYGYDFLATQYHSFVKESGGAAGRSISHSASYVQNDLDMYLASSNSYNYKQDAYEVSVSINF